MAIGYDVGTFTLVCCTRNEKKELQKVSEINAFLEVPVPKEDRSTFNMMKSAGVHLIERKDLGVAFALGESACSFAYTFNSPLRRPMKDGCLNPAERDGNMILATMIHGMLGEVKDNETLYYSVPANAINEETDADFHSKVLERVFLDFEDANGHKVNPRPINEGLALIYAELANKQYTGMGISCLCPGTKIYTKRGIVNIENVTENDYVLTHKGRWRKINKIITKSFNGLQTKLQITGYSNNTEDYKFVDDHELYVYRNGEWKWIGCESVHAGDIVGEPIEQFDPHSSTPTMTICERVTCSKKTKKKSISLSSNVYRLIGYFLADGSVNESEGTINFDFGIHETKYQNDVKEILQRCFGKESSFTKHGENCIRVKCYSKGMVSYFKNKFYNNDKKSFPWDLSVLRRSDCLNLLIGLIRGDGCISDSAISFCNTNTHLVMLAKQLFSRLGYAASMSYREPRSHYLEVEDRFITNKYPEWQVVVGSSYAFESLVSLINETSCKDKHMDKMFIHNNMCCGRIQKVETANYNGTVYDLQVEEDHSFSGPFLTIHNCGAGMVNVCFAIFGNPVFAFSLVNSGDWIDKQAAKATGESIAYINREKTKLDLTKPQDSLVQRTIAMQYELMVKKTVEGIAKGLESSSKKARTPSGDIDIVIAGGTASPPGFEILVSDTINKVKLPIQIGKIIKPNDPLYSVGRGCLIAAEASEIG